MNNFYIFYGTDERLIKEQIDDIINENVAIEFKDLNFVKFDGANLNIDKIINACETLPFMSPKKVVLMYRADFIGNDKDSKTEALFKKLLKVVDTLPEQTILITYFLLGENTKRSSSRIKKFKNNTLAMEVKKLWRADFERKVMGLFQNRDKKIGKAELTYFCGLVQENFDVINNEIDKLCDYTWGRDIKKEDIRNVISSSLEDDIFKLVDAISEKKGLIAIEIFNELILKGEKVNYIINMIQRQFRALYITKKSIEEGKSVGFISKTLKTPEFAVNKFINNTKNMSLSQIEKNIMFSLQADSKIKSTSVEKKTEGELLIVNCTK